VSISGPGEPTDEELATFLRNTLDLPEETRFTLARLQVGHGSERIVFFTSRADLLARRGVVRVTDGVPRVLLFEEDPCQCFTVEAETVALIPGQGDLALTRFSPVTGSCVGLDVVRILRVADDGGLVEVWRGTTFQAEGSTSTVAEVAFADRDRDGDLEIVRRGRVVDCGEECLCRNGPVLESFETVYDWSAGEGRFVEVR
jgi:hypothetical protein